MEYITRSQMIRSKLDDFLGQSSESHFHIDLYGSEIKWIRRKHPELEVEVGRPTKASAADKRLSCIIAYAKK